MRQVQIINRSRPLKQTLVARYCQSFLCKLRGLAFRSGLPATEGLILAEGREGRANTAVHMLGMSFDLSIVWLDSDLRVVDLGNARRRRSFLVPRKPARYVLECGASRFEEFRIGDQLAFEDLPAI